MFGFSPLQSAGIPARSSGSHVTVELMRGTNCLIRPVWYPTGTCARYGPDKVEKLLNVAVPSSHCSVRLPFIETQPMLSCQRRGWSVEFDVDFKASRIAVVTKLASSLVIDSNLSAMSTTRSKLDVEIRYSLTVGVLIVSWVISMVCKGVMIAPLICQFALTHHATSSMDSPGVLETYRTD